MDIAAALCSGTAIAPRHHSTIMKGTALSRVRLPWGHAPRVRSAIRKQRQFATVASDARSVNLKLRKD